MKIYNVDNFDTTNYISKKYIKINSCDIQNSNGQEFMVVRNKGRVDYHILYVAKGECICFYNDISQTLKRGEFAIYYPNEKQKYLFKDGVETTTLWVHFTGTEVAGLLSELHLMPGIHKGLYPEAIEMIFQKMISNHAFHTVKYECAANGCLLNLLSILSNEQGSYRLISYPPVILNSIEYIQINWQKNISVKELANLSNLSESRLSHLFKQSVGISIHRYITELKIEKSKEFLLNTNMHISEISSIVGFNDPLYFSRIFKSYTGCSPNAYKNMPQLDSC